MLVEARNNVIEFNNTQGTAQVETQSNQLEAG